MMSKALQLLFEFGMVFLPEQSLVPMPVPHGGPAIESRQDDEPKQHEQSHNPINREPTHDLLFGLGHLWFFVWSFPGLDVGDECLILSLQEIRTHEQARQLDHQPRAEQPPSGLRPKIILFKVGHWFVDDSSKSLVLSKREVASGGHDDHYDDDSKGEFEWIHGGLLELNWSGNEKYSVDLRNRPR